MSTEIALKNQPEQTLSKIEQFLVQGNLSVLSNEERLSYYNKVCESLNLNPLTKPFDYITLSGKLTLYANRSCTDQLRSARGISTRILSREKSDGLYIVIAQGTDASGRIAESMGAIKVEGLSGESLANAMMKGETKATRRVTLSFCGLGFLDESEIEGAVNAPFSNTKANISEAVRPQIEDSEERRKIISDLEKIMTETGLDALALEWKKISPEQRKLVGAVELQRIKTLSVTQPVEVSND